MQKENRNSRKGAAKETLEILEQGFYINAKDQKIDIKEAQEFTVANSMLIQPDELFDIAPEGKYKTEILLENCTTLEACASLARQTEDVFCLNFASAKNPGGGFLGGAQAQEESLARSSGLYPAINQMREMYDTNRKQKSCLYLDYMIYSPRVSFFRKDNNSLTDDFYVASVLTAPAVNAGVVKSKEQRNVPKIRPTMERRIDKVLSIAYQKGYETLVLGAWGCGVFQNDPHEIADIFASQLKSGGKFENVFKTVFFAVLDRKDRGVYRAFAEHFNS
ncbi:MAG: TIGR02452 family protein [Bacteroidota bacterium]